MKCIACGSTEKSGVYFFACDNCGSTFCNRCGYKGKKCTKCKNGYLK